MFLDQVYLIGLYLIGMASYLFGYYLGKRERKKEKSNYEESIIF